MTKTKTTVAVVALGTALLALGACGRGKNPDFTVYDPKDQRIRDRYGTVTGQDGFTLFGNGGEKRRAQLADSGAGGGGIGVNAYLWRGALDTLNFMPLASADPFGGLIISDWYQPATTPDERVKVNVLILDRSLRADALKVSVFRQVRQGGGWADSSVDPATATGLEDKILTRARELRIASAEAAG